MDSAIWSPGRDFYCGDAWTAERERRPLVRTPR